ncbi:hypothetical protein RRG08_029162 [Elysia crispata]|uniref:Uncharacterized protein n=1 Tax=Elysia crispata TaxID=231223 RepID=A0AAE1AJB4_9GAST|nr:hypothetical protein RRG08_029162 [Elysia crispata]
MGSRVDSLEIAFTPRVKDLSLQSEARRHKRIGGNKAELSSRERPECVSGLNGNDVAYPNPSEYADKDLSDKLFPKDFIEKQTVHLPRGEPEGLTVPGLTCDRKQAIVIRN